MGSSTTYGPGIKQVRFHIKLLKSTVMAAFSARFQVPRALIPSQCFQDMMITSLREALTRAGQSMKQGNSGNLKDIIEELANLVLRVGSEVPDQLKAPPPFGTDLGAGQEWRIWSALQDSWLEEVAVLGERVREVSTSLAVQHGDSVGETA
jgi:hypothetical protein